MPKLKMEFREHEIGNVECEACRRPSYAQLCTCGGVIHDEFFDESWDTVLLVYQCDKCEFRVVGDDDRVERALRYA